MAQVSDALRKDIDKYINYRFSHFDKDKRDRRICDTLARISEVSDKDSLRFHKDIIQFFDTNKDGIKRVKEVKINPIQNIEVEHFIKNKPSKRQMLRLIRKYDGDFNEIIKEHNDSHD